MLLGIVIYLAFKPAAVSPPPQRLVTPPDAATLHSPSPLLAKTAAPSNPPPPPGPYTLIASGSTWHYFDSGEVASWPETDSSSWKNGSAPLGYGDDGEATQLEKKKSCYYFRQEFQLDKPANIRALRLHISCDDGAIIYLNGKEIQRIAMPAGAIAYSTLAKKHDAAWAEYEVPTQALHAGRNILAVEIHNTSLNSSDIFFDLKLIAEST